jgi:anti-sigma B factor antagonist
MELNTSETNGVSTVELVGNLDTASAGTAEAELMKLLDADASKLLLNFSAVPFIASSGLRVLLKVGQALKARGGTLHICCINDTVREVFEISGFDRIFNVFASAEDAFGGFG